MCVHVQVPKLGGNFLCYMTLFGAADPEFICVATTCFWCVCVCVLCVCVVCVCVCVVCVCVGYCRQCDVNGVGAF